MVLHFSRGSIFELPAIMTTLLDTAVNVICNGAGQWRIRCEHGYQL